MANYYELLKVSTSASTEEIQAAVDTQYDQWRQLVTHHDPNVVNQANQATQLLEQIRATLSDPAKRAAYDEGIGLRSVGGLADPSAILNPPKGGMTPPAPRPQPLPDKPAAVAPSTLWACPKCGSNNPEHTTYCFKCGTQLVRKCPECGQNTSLVATGFCGHCGYNYEVALRRNELSTEITSLQEKIANANSRLAEASGRNTSSGLFWGVVGIGAALFSLSLLGNSGSAGCGVVGILGGGVLAALVFIGMSNASSKKKADIQNATQEIESSKTTLTRVQQEYGSLALRKTEPH